jgi:hypothetical protein
MFGQICVHWKSMIKLFATFATLCSITSYYLLYQCIVFIVISTFEVMNLGLLRWAHVIYTLSCGFLLPLLTLSYVALSKINSLLHFWFLLHLVFGVFSLNLDPQKIVFLCFELVLHLAFQPSRLHISWFFSSLFNLCYILHFNLDYQTQFVFCLAFCKSF